jgi:outer membrane protein assembly factor BamB
LATKGDFLGTDGDKTIKVLSILRSIGGLVILASVALAYPGYTKPMSELVATNGNTPTGIVALLKLADSSLTTTLYGLLIFLLCIFAFAVPTVALARSRKRLVALGHLCLPLITFALFAGLMGVIVGTFDLFNLVATRLDLHASNLHGLGPAVIALVEILILAVLFLAVVPVLLLWYAKAIYLAAVDVFRADDAHPLLAPFGTTVVSWSLAGFAWLAGGPTGVPHNLGWLLLFGGPVGVSFLNVWACVRLWQAYSDVLFRDGPVGRGPSRPRTTASYGTGGAVKSRREIIVVGGVVAVVGPLTMAAVVLGFTNPSTSGPVSLRWSYTTGNFVDSPAVAGGTVYIGSDDDKVYALNAATGRLRWSYTTGHDVYSSPAVAGGTVYIGSDDDKVYALNAATGRLRWSYSTAGAVESSPAVAGGTVYIGSFDHKVYALNAATGHLRWSYSTAGAVVSRPAVAAGTVYVGSFDDRVYALDAATGHLRWSYTTGSDVYSSPAVAGGTVYIGSEDDNVYALNAATGRLRWSFKTGRGVYSSPVVAGGTVYAGSTDDTVYALDAATGRLRWSYPTGDYVNSSPALAGGVVYIGSNDNRVYALDAATGHLRWFYTTADSVISTPAVAAGLVYVGGGGDTLYALHAAG